MRGGDEVNFLLWHHTDKTIFLYKPPSMGLVDCQGAVGCCPILRMMWDRKVTYWGARELHRYLLKKKKARPSMQYHEFASDGCRLTCAPFPYSLTQACFLIYFFDKSFPASQTAEGLIQLH